MEVLLSLRSVIERRIMRCRNFMIDRTLFLLPSIIVFNLAINFYSLKYLMIYTILELNEN